MPCGEVKGLAYNLQVMCSSTLSSFEVRSCLKTSLTFLSTTLTNNRTSSNEINTFLNRIFFSEKSFSPTNSVQ